MTFETHPSSLSGQLLVAMPGMDDARFERRVIYMCAHSHEGAMGLVINHTHPHLTFASLIKQLGISKPFSTLFSSSPSHQDIPLMLGGPVEVDRGFVLHTSDYFDDEGTVPLTETFSLSATSTVIEALAYPSSEAGAVPQHSIVCLGYASWGGGQLEDELLDNVWLVTPATEELVFHSDPDTLYTRALGAIGLSENALFAPAGNA